MSNDKTLRDDVLLELDWEPSIESAEIGVAVENGVVTLTGHVPSFAQKTRAETVVKRVRGVKAIAQEIEVRLPHTATQADDEIAKRAIAILKWDTMVPDDRIKMTVEDGWITLTGEVDWEYQRRAAEDDVRKLSGVRGAFNHITIKARPQPTDIKKRIEDALKRNALVEASGITVSVVDGTVTLRGKVPSWHDRDVLETAVWSAPGVKIVDDRVSVG